MSSELTSISLVGNRKCSFALILQVSCVLKQRSSHCFANSGCVGTCCIVIEAAEPPEANNTSSLSVHPCNGNIENIRTWSGVSGDYMKRIRRIVGRRIMSRLCQLQRVALVIVIVVYRYRDFRSFT